MNFDLESLIEIKKSAGVATHLLLMTLLGTVASSDVILDSGYRCTNFFSKPL